jgi:hypothetical protein
MALRMVAVVQPDPRRVPTPLRLPRRAIDYFEHLDTLGQHDLWEGADEVRGRFG